MWLGLVEWRNNVWYIHYLSYERLQWETMGRNCLKNYIWWLFLFLCFCSYGYQEFTYLFVKLWVLGQRTYEEKDIMTNCEGLFSWYILKTFSDNPGGENTCKSDNISSQIARSFDATTLSEKQDFLINRINSLESTKKEMSHLNGTRKNIVYSPHLCCYRHIPCSLSWAFSTQQEGPRAGLEQPSCFSLAEMESQLPLLGAKVPSSSRKASLWGC